MALADNIHFIGDSCLCWSFGKGIDPRTSRRVIQAYRFLKEHQVAGVLDCVPSYCALAVHFDPLQADADELVPAINGLLERAARERVSGKGVTHRIPVVYDGMDLADLARGKQMTVRDVVRLHSSKTYTVAMIGFRPHFPYLLGLDPRLETPRLASPRPRVPPGSVGIGGNQTGIYPDESPGGWSLIGRTSPGLLIDIAIGDKVKFRSVSAL
jgi:KipI family sensor histidine kinase inhibitor